MKNNDYDLSINKYKKVTVTESNYENSEQIYKRLLESNKKYEEILLAIGDLIK